MSEPSYCLQLIAAQLCTLQANMKPNVWTKNQQGSAPIQRQLAALPVVGGEKRREFEAEDLSANLVFQLGLVE
jgi:hypothetical protein